MNKSESLHRLVSPTIKLSHLATSTGCSGCDNLLISTLVGYSLGSCLDFKVSLHQRYINFQALSSGGNHAQGQFIITLRCHKVFINCFHEEVIDLIRGTYTYIWSLDEVTRALKVSSTIISTQKPATHIDQCFVHDLRNFLLAKRRSISKSDDELMR
jgi:hypothetical protein